MADAPPRSRGQQPNRNVGDGRQEEKWPPAPKPYNSEYFLKNGVIRRELLLEEAEKLAQEFVRRRLNSAQLRRFYNEVKALEARIDAEGYDKCEPMLWLLRAKVAYACPKQGEKKIPDEFAKFLWDCIAQIQGREEFRAFCKVFEAVVGYFYGKGGRAA